MENLKRVDVYICSKCGRQWSVYNGTPNEPCPNCGEYIPKRFSFEQNSKLEFVREIK